VTVANVKADSFEDWDAPDDPDWEAELLSRAAAQGPRFEQLVEAVMRKIAWNKRDRNQVRLWLIVCLTQFERRQIVQSKVQDWCVKVSKRAASLAELLECEPFPKGSAQSDFLFVNLDDIAHLRNMAVAAQEMASHHRKVGAGRRHDREALIDELASGFERLTSRRATATAGNPFCGVVTDVLAFIREYPKEDTVTGAVKRVLKTRRRLRKG
jgi:hypothetical protein